MMIMMTVVKAPLLNICRFPMALVDWWMDGYVDGWMDWLRNRGSIGFLKIEFDDDDAVADESSSSDTPKFRIRHTP